jgi:hypothetical protein
LATKIRRSRPHWMSVRKAATDDRIRHTSDSAPETRRVRSRRKMCGIFAPLKTCWLFCARMFYTGDCVDDVNIRVHACRGRARWSDSDGRCTSE